MKKLYLSLAFLIALSTLSVLGQRTWGNPVGQYPYNPSGAAMNDLGELVSVYYRNFISATNSPTGILLMGSSPFANDNMGAGFRFTSQSGGVLENLMAEATFVYKAQVSRNSKLAFGLSGVYNQMGIQSDLVNAQHPEDPILALGADGGSWMDVNFGMSLYQPNKYFVGLAMYNLMGQKTNWLLTNFENRSARLGTLSGMYSLDLFQGKWKLETNGVVLAYVPQDEYSFSTMSYDITTRMIMNKAFWVGSGYADGKIKVLCGLYVQNLAVGYAGAIALGDLATSSYNIPQHELFLRLELDNSKSSRSSGR